MIPRADMILTVIREEQKRGLKEKANTQTCNSYDEVHQKLLYEQCLKSTVYIHISTWNGKTLI